jgi:hypothetical protein
MKRVVPLSVLTVVASLALAGPPASGAGKLHEHDYSGKTSAGGAIYVQLLRTDSAAFLEGFDLNARLTCDDGSHEEVGFGVGFGRGPKLKDGVLSFDENWGDLALHLHGHFGTKRGAGTIEYTEAQLDQSEDAIACTTGQLRFRVTRRSRRSTAPAIAATTSAPSRHVVIRNGRITEQTSTS